MCSCVETAFAHVCFQKCLTAKKSQSDHLDDDTNLKDREERNEPLYTMESPEEVSGEAVLRSSPSSGGGEVFAVTN